MRRALVLLAACAVLLAAGCTAAPFVDRVSQPGDAAHDLVSGKRYAKLVIELDHPSGHAPNAAALEHLKGTLREVTGKSSVDVVQDASIPAAPGKSYSWDEIEALEREHRSRHTGGDTAALYLMYVAGGSADDTSDGKVLGAAYRGTSLVLFEGNVDASSGGFGQPAEQYLEGAVLVHEFGHAAGLVDLGTPMVRPHEDPGHEGHSSNRESVMYWAIENTAGLFGLLTCGPLDPSCGIPMEFDADDKADLKALRER